MSIATATATPPRSPALERFDPPEIPDVRFIRLAEVSAAMGEGTFCAHLERECTRLGIETLVAGDRAKRIRMRDLPKLVTPPVARTVEHTYQPLNCRTGVAGDILGVWHTEVAGLCGRRGVLVIRITHEPVMPLGSVYTLRRILDVERSFPIEEDDYFPVARVLPRLREVQTTQVSAGPGAIMTTAEYIEADQTRELEERCGWVGVRCVLRGERGHMGRIFNGRRHAVGLDLYRLCNIVMDPARVPGYQELMAEAYEKIVPPLRAEEDASS